MQCGFAKRISGVDQRGRYARDGVQGAAREQAARPHTAAGVLEGVVGDDTDVVTDCASVHKSRLDLMEPAGLV